MKRFRLTIENYSVPMLLLGAGIVVTVALLWFKLGSLTPGLSQDELMLQRQVADQQLQIQDIIRHAVFLPYYFGLFILQYLPHGYTAIRSLSALIALITIIGFYGVLRYWHTTRIAILGTILFATSTGLLHTGRYGVPISMFFMLFILLASWIWLASRSAHKSSWLIAILLVGFSLYVPGLIWFIIPALILHRRAISKAFRHIPIGYALMTLASGLVIIAPFILTIAWPLPGSTAAGNARELLGIPMAMPSLAEFGRNLLNIPQYLFISSAPNPVLTLGRLPILDIFTTVMFIIGVYAYAKARKLDRTKSIFIILLLSSVLIALGGGVSIALILPFIYLIAAEGISHLLREWLTVFPRNPFARGVGITIVSVAVGVTVFYHTKNYFIAWPKNPATKTTFQHRI